jgi:hypothetical protein
LFFNENIVVILLLDPSTPASLIRPVVLYSEAMHSTYMKTSVCSVQQNVSDALTPYLLKVLEHLINVIQPNHTLMQEKHTNDTNETHTTS